MNDKTSVSGMWGGVVVLVVLTALVAFTAIRIEWFNHQVGGFLPRPQPSSVEGNDVKWRTTSPDMAEQSYRRALAYERGLELQDRDLASLALNEREQADIRELRRQAVLNTSFRAFTASMGLLQYLLVPAGVIGGIWLWQTRVSRVRSVAAICIAFHLIAGGLMLYRGYYPSLGW